MHGAHGGMHVECFRLFNDIMTANEENKGEKIAMREEEAVMLDVNEIENQ